jgi:hypothetical protein
MNLASRLLSFSPESFAGVAEASEEAMVAAAWQESAEAMAMEEAVVVGDTGEVAIVEEAEEETREDAEATRATEEDAVAEEVMKPSWPMESM